MKILQEGFVVKLSQGNLLSSVFTILVLGAACAGTGSASAGQTGELTMAGLTAWLDAYGNAWESRDAEKAAMLFAEESSYQVTPYEEPHTGPDGVREYWAGVTENQRNIRFEYQPLSVSGNTGIAHWSAEFDVESGGTHIELDGIFVLEFDASGKCARLREWWHLNSQEAAAE